MLVVTALVALSFNTETAFALATIPLGIAWMVTAIGAVLGRPVPSGPAAA